MKPSQSPTAEALTRSLEPGKETAVLPGDDGMMLRRSGEPESLLHIGPSTAAAVGAFNRVMTSRKSEVLLMWPQRQDSVAALHALAALNLIGDCDSKRLATLFFPWNRNTAGAQRTLLVDKDYIYRATLPPLNRVSIERYRHPVSGYLLALHSVNHLLASGKKDKRLRKALEGDPGLAHPSLYEIMPQHGVQSDGLRRYDDQFLRRLRRHTWICECKEYIEAASDLLRTPFFLFGVDVDALNVSLFRDAGLDPDARGRQPDVVLIDMTWRARNRIENTNWRKALSRFFDIVNELYGKDSPPVLAITDDVFVLQALRWDVIKEYDGRRGAPAGHTRPTTAQVILNPSSDLLNQETIAESPPPDISAEVYGTDILRMVDTGMKLRRSLADAGDNELADAVSAAVNVIQNLIGLPGQPQQFHQFLTDNSEGSERQRMGAWFDHQAPRSKMASALKAGLAGSNHDVLSKFSNAFDELCRVADTDNPGRRRFDECIRALTCADGRSIVVFSGEVQRGFAEWRIENDPALADVRSSLAARGESR